MEVIQTIDDRIGRRTRVKADQKNLSAGKHLVLFMYSIFVIVVLIEPAYISEQLKGSIHQMFYLSKYLAAGSALFLYLIRRTRLNGLLVGCLFFELALFFPTLLYNASLDNWLKDCAYTVAFLFFLQVVMEIDGEILLRALSVVLGIYVNLNTLSWLAYPDGLYRNNLGYQNCWFLGYDNVAAVIIVVTIAVCLFRILLYRGKRVLWDWIVILSGVWFIFALGVANAIVAVVFFFLLLAVTGNPGLRSRIGSARLIVLGMFGLFFLIQFFNVQQSNVFSFIFKLLKKSTTFSQRIFLWEKAWTDLADGSILLGFGVHDAAEYVRHFGKYWNVHLHCYYLQALYEGGILAFGALFGWIFYAAGIFDRTEHSYSAMAVLGGILAILFMWQVEASNNLIRYFIIVLFLLYNAGFFESLGLRGATRKYRLVFRPSR